MAIEHHDMSPTDIERYYNKGIPFPTNTLHWKCKHRNFNVLHLVNCQGLHKTIIHCFWQRILMRDSISLPFLYNSDSSFPYTQNTPSWRQIDIFSQIILSEPYIYNGNDISNSVYHLWYLILHILGSMTIMCQRSGRCEKWFDIITL